MVVSIHPPTLRDLLIVDVINGKMVFALNVLLDGFSMLIKFVPKLMMTVEHMSQIVNAQAAIWVMI